MLSVGPFPKLTWDRSGYLPIGEGIPYAHGNPPCGIRSLEYFSLTTKLALKGLEFLEHIGIGCKKVIIEYYSLELIHACNGIIEVWSPYSAILAVFLNI